MQKKRKYLNRKSLFPLHVPTENISISIYVNMRNVILLTRNVPIRIICRQPLFHGLRCVQKPFKNEVSFRLPVVCCEFAAFATIFSTFEMFLFSFLQLILFPLLKKEKFKHFFFNNVLQIRR